jgi:hypothetical protein
MRRQETTANLRRMVLGGIVLVLVQAGIGMVVNLDVSIPDHHPGAHPSNYFGGSFHSVAWAVAHGGLALAVHVSLGLALIVMVIAIAIRALRIANRAIGAWSTLAGCLVIGAAFNGASFLDFNKDINSLIMALLALSAVESYSAALFQLGSTTQERVALHKPDSREVAEVI